MVKISIEASEHIEEEYAIKDSATNEQNRWYHNIHLFFTRHDESKQSGRPHHIGLWLNGLMTGWGARRGVSKRNR